MRAGRAPAGEPPLQGAEVPVRLRRDCEAADHGGELTVQAGRGGGDVQDVV